MEALTDAYASLLIKQGKLEQARRLLRQQVKRLPKSALLLAELGTVGSQLGERPAVVERILKRAAALEPSTGGRAAVALAAFIARKQAGDGSMPVAE